MLKTFRTYQLAVNFYKEAKHLTLLGAQKNQYERALLSIPLNLAEGSAKPTRKDRRKFYYIALGSLREVQTILSLADKPDLASQADMLGAHLYRLCHRC
jgi:four helix bundle protein